MDKRAKDIFDSSVERFQEKIQTYLDRSLFDPLRRGLNDAMYHMDCIKFKTKKFEKLENGECRMNLDYPEHAEITINENCNIWTDDFIEEVIVHELMHYIVNLAYNRDINHGKEFFDLGLVLGVKLKEFGDARYLNLMGWVKNDKYNPNNG